MSRFHSVFKSCLVRSTVRGIPRIVHSPTALLRVLWILTVVSCFTLGLSQVIQLIIDFVNRPTITVMESYFPDNPRKQKFPAITICNHNPISSAYDKSVSNVTRSVYYDIVNQELKTKHLQERYNLSEQFLRTIFFSHRGYFQFLGRDKARRFGHNFSTLVHSCSWLDKEDGIVNCDKDEGNIKLFQHPDFFNCYTLETERTGNIQLSLVLYLDNFQKMSEFFNLYLTSGESHGARIIFHEAGAYPALDNDFAEVKPGSSVSFNVKRQERTLLSEPYGDCYDTDTDSMQTQKWANYTYSVDLCQEICLIESILKECKCQPEYQIQSCVTDTKDDDKLCKHIQEIQKNNFVRLKCILCSDLTKIDHIKTCPCRHPCEYSSFLIQENVAEWPVKSHIIAFYNQFIASRPYADKFQIYSQIYDMMQANETEAMQTLSNSRLIEDNFIHVRINFEAREVLAVRASQKYTVVNLLSAIGGAFNFYSGITVIILMEIVEMILMMICGKNQQQKRVDKQTQTCKCFSSKTSPARTETPL